MVRGSRAELKVILAGARCKSLALRRKSSIEGDSAAPCRLSISHEAREIPSG
jgi:hypothetical protein